MSVVSIVEFVIVFLARRLDPTVAPGAVRAHDASVARSRAVLAVGVAVVASGGAIAREVENPGEERTEGRSARGNDADVDLKATQSVLSLGLGEEQDLQSPELDPIVTSRSC
jgi:hypothetical protein